MRIFSAMLIASLLAGQSIAVSAAPVSLAMKASSAIQLIEDAKKTDKKADDKKAEPKKADAKKADDKKADKKADAPKKPKKKGHKLCGVGMYHKGGKCVSAADKK
jgi:hypothetical protein